MARLSWTTLLLLAWLAGAAGCRKAATTGPKDAGPPKEGPHSIKDKKGRPIQPLP
jgi:hypothetical protein